MSVLLGKVSFDQEEEEEEATINYKREGRGFYHGSSIIQPTIQLLCFLAKGISDTHWRNVKASPLNY